MNRRCINDRILILCSGISEYLYAKALVRELHKDQQQGVAVDQCHSIGHGLYSLFVEAERRIRQAKADRNAFTAVWLFFGKSNNEDDAAALAVMEQAGLYLAYTPICFEYWVTIHFADCTHYESSEDALQQVKRSWPEYKKCQTGVFEALRSRMPQAIERAALVQHTDEKDLLYLTSPLFTVQQLIAYIESLKK